ncbi:YjdF family protein [Leptolyngbya sp. AN03gr2]
MKLTIFFNGQFWEGVVELYADNELKVGRHIFGVEPQDVEVLAFIVNNVFLSLLTQASASVEVTPIFLKRVNPKRMARQVSQEMANQGVSTFAQEVMRQNLEERKQASKQRSKAMREAEEEEKWQRSRQKAKARHRGKA